MLLPSVLHYDLALQNIQKALRRRRTQTAARFEFDGVLREGGPQRARGVYDGRGAKHARPKRAHKRIGRENAVIALRHAARLSEMIHEVSCMSGRTNRPGGPVMTTPSRKMVWPRKSVR